MGYLGFRYFDIGWWIGNCSSMFVCRGIGFMIVMESRFVRCVSW